MTNHMMQQHQDGHDAPAKRRVPKGQRLPQSTPADVVPMVKALAGFNGPVSKKRVAGSMGMTVGGGAFEGKWASMGYYGFREDTPDGRIEVTERGRALISDDGAAVLEAKRHALVSTGFRVILNRFSTNPVNLPAIEGVLEEELGVPESQAKKLANVLVKSAEDAEMVIEDRFQIAAIEPAIEAVGEISITAAPRSASSGTSKPNGGVAKGTPSAPLRQTTPNPKASAPTVQKVETEGQSGPFGVSVEIKIDAKAHTPQEIGEIVRQVRDALIPAA